MSPSEDLSANSQERTAKVLAKAILVFGSKQRAEAWLNKPASALNGRRPIDLAATQHGQELIDQVLMRLDHGVYT